MSELSTKLHDYVWKFSWVYVLCVILCLVIFVLLKIEFFSTLSMIQLLVSAMATKMIFLQKEQRKLKKEEKSFLVNACFGAACLISLITVALYGLFLIITLGLASTQTVLKQLFPVDLSVWMWVGIIAVSCLIAYGSLALGFGDSFGSDDKILEAQRKKQASK